MAINILFIFCILLNCLALYFAIQHKIPHPFPWIWALVFALVLLLGAFTPLGTAERYFYFVTFLSAVIVTYNLRQYPRELKYIAVWLAISVTFITFFDTFRFIRSPDVVITPGELHLNGLIRRPYFLEHPNLIAAQMLLMPFGIWTILTVLLTQSRGALFGLVPVLIMRYVPRSWRGWVLPIGAVILFLGILIRPDTVLGRLSIWEEGLRFFWARPLLGWGTGSYLASLSAPDNIMNAVVNFQRIGLHTAHNALITIAAENGLLGLVPLVGLLVIVFMSARKSEHPARWGLLAFGIQQMFDDQWLHPVTSIVLGCCLAVCLFYREGQEYG
jgi:hypothetical protein